MKINSHNEWDTLKEVVLGTMDGYFPGLEFTKKFKYKNSSNYDHSKPDAHNVQNNGYGVRFASTFKYLGGGMQVGVTGFVQNYYIEDSRVKEVSLGHFTMEPKNHTRQAGMALTVYF